MNEINVKKRNGNLEPLSIEKINKVLLWATEDIDNTSASEIAMNSNIQFYDGITSDEIHQVLISSCVDLISEETPNYDIVGGRLFNLHLRKNVFNTFNNLPSLYEHITNMVDSNWYSNDFFFFLYFLCFFFQAEDGIRDF